jgi:hypothetical protein
MRPGNWRLSLPQRLPSRPLRRIGKQKSHQTTLESGRRTSSTARGHGTECAAFLNGTGAETREQQFFSRPNRTQRPPAGRLILQDRDGAPTIITTAFGNIVVTRIGDSGTSKGVPDASEASPANRSLATLYDFLEDTIRYLAIIPPQGRYFALGQQLPH